MHLLAWGVIGQLFSHQETITLFPVVNNVTQFHQTAVLLELL